MSRRKTENQYEEKTLEDGGAAAGPAWMDPSFGPPVYVQIPFCPDRCDYCAIPVSTRTGLVPAYLQTLEGEIRRILPALGGRPPLAVYVGGGSPTSLEKEPFATLLDILRPLTRLTREVTFESRPEALTPEILSALEEVPALRLSLGIEALEAQGLALLGRSAPPVDPVELLARLRDRLSCPISMDFICPGERSFLPAFLPLARRLRAGGLDHLSLYPLVIEDQTVSALRKSRRELEADLEEQAAEIWNESCEGLGEGGWHRYEVANFSRDPRSVCRYNLHVWKGGDYFGIGSGAHQKIGSVRTENVRSISDYLRLSEGGTVRSMASEERLAPESLAVESLYTNLRLSDGLSLSWLMNRTDRRSTVDRIDGFVKNGWVDGSRRQDGVLALTSAGLFRLDSIAESLLEGFSSPRVS